MTGKSSLWRLEWDEGLSVGIPEIDADHQRFIRLINELNEAISSRMGREEIRKRVRLMLEDAASHFAHEEALFKNWGYPETVEHAKKHKQLFIAMNKVIGSIEHDSTEYKLIEAALFLKGALIEHLLNEDMKFRDYGLRKKSLQTE